MEWPGVLPPGARIGPGVREASAWEEPATSVEAQWPASPKVGWLLGGRWGAGPAWHAVACGAGPRWLCHAFAAHSVLRCAELELLAVPGQIRHCWQQAAGTEGVARHGMQAPVCLPGRPHPTPSGPAEPPLSQARAVAPVSPRGAQCCPARNVYAWTRWWLRIVYSCTHVSQGWQWLAAAKCCAVLHEKSGRGLL